MFCFFNEIYCLGQLATDAFEDVGHSEDARELMKDYYIGDLTEVSAVT